MKLFFRTDNLISTKAFSTEAEERLNKHFNAQSSNNTLLSNPTQQEDQHQAHPHIRQTSAQYFVYLTTGSHP
jgi:DNA topoisomerase IA